MSYIDFHCDTLSRLLEHPEENLVENTGHIDLRRLLSVGTLAQFFACYVDTEYPAFTASHYDDVLKMAETLKTTLAGNPSAALALNYEDYLKNRQENKLSCFLTVEEGGVLENDMQRLYQLHDIGIRLITLTWNHENCLGFPHNMNSVPGTGLKPFGIDVIKEMERLKMLIDVSHLSDQGFYDVLKNTTRPFVASHSCCRDVFGHSRNLTDQMIHDLGERQGLVGINFYGEFMSNNNTSTIEEIIHHLKHLINVGGLDIAAIGSDFDGIDGNLEITGCQDMPLLFNAMEKAGFKPSEIDAVCYKNAERVLGFL